MRPKNYSKNNGNDADDDKFQGDIVVEERKNVMIFMQTASMLKRILN